MSYPAITSVITCVSLITYAIPGQTDLFVFDRQYILDGELWRLLTAPFVHFSASHLIWNLLVFAAAGCAVELAGYQRFGLVCALSIIIPGLLFLMLNPHLTRYGGLSALAMGAVAYFCLNQVRQTGRNRILWIAMLVLLILKIFAESLNDKPIFAQSDSIPLQVLPSAHAVGFSAAVIVFVSKRMKKGGRVQPSKSDGL